MRLMQGSVWIVILCLSGLFAEEQAPLPKVWSKENKDRIADALQVWRLLRDYFPKGKDDEDGSDLEVPQVMLEPKTERTFENYSEWTREFLSIPRLAPGVQFSCARGICYEESIIRQAMMDPKSSPELQLQALVLLVIVRSPSSVRDQWTTLQALKKLDKGPNWKTLLSELESCFSSASLQYLLKDWSPPVTGAEKMDRYGNLPGITSWSIRAAGLMQCRELLPKIREWSVNDHLDTSLEAEWSLAQYKGPEAEDALAYCVKGWQYNASVHAAHELMERNPKKLADTLVAMGPPRERLYEYARLLAHTGDARAVPMLCETVRGVNIVDGDMFSRIEALARAEDLPLIKDLPGKVREDQKARAEKVLKAVQAKYQ